MKTMQIAKFSTCGLIAGLMVPGAAYAANVAGDNFDTSVQGVDYLTRSFSPDNSGNFSFDGVTPGVFPSSNFDVFGITNRNVNNDFADDSASTFPADTFGFAGVGANDPGNFVGIADTVNNDNIGNVTATWTFDISGFENLAVNIDMVGYGDFEDADLFIFQARVDGGSPVITHNVGMTPEQDAADNFFFLQMDGGATPDRAPSAFFSDAEHQFLLDNSATIQANGPQVFDPDGTPNNGDEVTIGFALDDDGSTNGDTTAFDGIVPITGGAGTVDERSYQVENNFGTFQQPESVPFKDPIFEQNSNTQLNNELQTITSALAGTGNTLTLTLTANTNGGGEVFAFDNILITGDAIGGEGILGDYNDSGLVEQGDLDQVLSNWGAGFASIPGTWINQRPTEGIVDQAELDVVLTEWGSSAAPDFAGSAVPEPATLALLGLGGLAMLRRRA